MDNSNVSAPIPARKSSIAVLSSRFFRRSAEKIRELKGERGEYTIYGCSTSTTFSESTRSTFNSLLSRIRISNGAAPARRLEKVLIASRRPSCGVFVPARPGSTASSSRSIGTPLSRAEPPAHFIIFAALPQCDVRLPTLHIKKNTELATLI